jgi:uncharacterized DUF497 family protein
MRISYDPNKRLRTVAERGLDFDDVVEVFKGPTFDFVDDRRDYGEIRTITIGYINRRMVVVVWTQRGETRHIISLRKANDREKARFTDRLGQVR